VGANCIGKDESVQPSHLHDVAYVDAGHSVSRGRDARSGLGGG